MMKGALLPDRLNPMDVILESLARTFSPFDKYEEKRLQELDEVRKGNLTLIFSRKEKK